MLNRGSLVALLAGSALALFAAPHASKGLLLVANKGDAALGIVESASGLQVAAVAEGGVTGHEVAASPDGRTAFVPIFGNSGVGQPGTDGEKIAVIDIAARKVTSTIEFGKGVRPHCPVFGPRNGMLYVTTELLNAVTLIDPKTLKIVGSVPTGQPESHMLAISHDGKLGYTANVGPGTVSVLDLEGRKTVEVIAVAKTVQRISISADDRWVFTADQGAPRLAVIDTKTRKVARWVELPGSAYGTAVTPDGRWLLAAIQKTNQVAVVDLAAMKVERVIEVPKIPQEMLIRPDGQVAYVSCDRSAQVAEISLTDWKVMRLIAAGKGADGLAWAATK